MQKQRWGIYAVDDHLDAERLIPELLLYDRLVLPYPTDGDRARWKQNHWDPDALDRRIELLGPSLVETVPWDKEIRGDWALAHDKLKQDAKNMAPEVRKRLGHIATPMALRARMEPVKGVEAVTSFPSLSHMRTAWSLELSRVAGVNNGGPAGSREGARSSSASVTHAAMLAYEILAPVEVRDPEGALKEIVALAKDEGFQRKRRRFYGWQSSIMRGEQADLRGALEQLADMLRDYNADVKRATAKVDKKLAFVVGGVALSIASSLLSANPLPLVGAALAITQFAVMDMKIEAAFSEAAPAAMLHDALEALRRH